ncbi:lysoplasmalogenase family protein [Paenibacillus nanensis]|nr:lysoplasmalogenase family protein [Paenibacillus nanensis]
MPDSFLAWNKFIAKVPQERTVMATYYAAQFCIARSLLAASPSITS